MLKKPKEMRVLPIQTSVFEHGQSFNNFLSESIDGRIEENDVIAVSTKIVSINEGCTVAKESISKEELVRNEADHFLGEIGYNIFLTIKDGLFIPSAGVDASNSKNDEYLVYPRKPFDSAQKIWKFLTQKYSVKNLGVILVDSHTTPLRRGTSGIALSYWGFKAVRDYRGRPDLEGQPLEYTYLNLLDGLACTANLTMGEGNECTPLVLIKGADIEFTNEMDSSEVQIPLEEDLYYPFFKHALNKKN